MKIDQQVYKSSTLGDIPLSFMGKHHMQHLREVMTELLTQRERAVRRGEVSPVSDWDQLSRARGRIAQYMSQLERQQNQFYLTDVPTHLLLEEITRRLK